MNRRDDVESLWVTGEWEVKRVECGKVGIGFNGLIVYMGLME